MLAVLFAGALTQVLCTVDLRTFRHFPDPVYPRAPPVSG